MYFLSVVDYIFHSFYCSAKLTVNTLRYLIDDDVFEGLFGMGVIGYGVALIIANQAVQYFQFGQPALLYIVPLMLIPVLWRTYDEGTINELWEKLPLPRTIAEPLGYEERRRLVNGNSDLIDVSASWGESTGELNIKIPKNRNRKNKIAGGGTA